MKITRLHVFSNDTTAESVEANQEFDQILDLSNGKLEGDNFIPCLKIGWDTLHVDSPFTAFIGVFDRADALPKTVDFGGKRISSVVAYTKDNKSFMLGTSDSSSPLNLSGVYKWEICDVSKDPDTSSIADAISNDQSRVTTLENETAGETDHLYQITEFEGLEEKLDDYETRILSLSSLSSNESLQDAAISEDDRRVSILESGSIPSIPASSNRPLISVAAQSVDLSNFGYPSSSEARITDCYYNGEKFYTYAKVYPGEFWDNPNNEACLELGRPGYFLVEAEMEFKNNSTIPGHFYFRIMHKDYNGYSIPYWDTKEAYEKGDPSIPRADHPVYGPNWDYSKTVKTYLLPGEKKTLICFLTGYTPTNSYFGFYYGTDTPNCYGAFTSSPTLTAQMLST